MCEPVVVNPPPSTNGLAEVQTAERVLLLPVLKPDVALTTSTLPTGIVAAAAGVMPIVCTTATPTATATRALAAAMKGRLVYLITSRK
jgi:hypothetical protein